MRRVFRGLMALVTSWLTLAWGSCRAADVQTLLTKANLTVIGVAGELHLGDEERFRSVAEHVQSAVVLFGSPGGNVVAAIRIGDYIRARGFGTAIVKEEECASACALAWLAGAPRMMGPDARVGFHGAFVLQRGIATESGPGNALVGAYLNRIGISDRAIYELTVASPNDMNWLTLQGAESIGIQVEPISDRDTEKAVPAQPSRVAENRVIDQLTDKANAEIQAAYSQRSSGSTAHVPTPLPADLAEFAAGSINSTCEVSCSFHWGTVRLRAEQFYRAGDWESLARLVVDRMFGQDLPYFYLGVSAYNLGYYQAAENYFNTAYFYSTKTTTRCSFFISQCSGHHFPDEEISAYKILKQQEAVQQATFTGLVSSDRDAIREYVDCVWSASNELDDGKSDATTIALAVEPQCRSRMQGIRDRIEGTWSADRRRQIDPLMSAETTKLIVQVVLVQRKAPSG